MSFLSRKGLVNGPTYNVQTITEITALVIVTRRSMSEEGTLMCYFST